MKRPSNSGSADVTSQLRRWYSRRHRPLPWRRNTDPYRIWISEVMLQQTQVKTVVPYFERFVARFPDPESLASAEVNEVLELWAGLGYYSRGRNLHRAAQRIRSDHGGRFPRDPAAIRGLPGIGEYTTNAIASIAFREPLAVVDGNVERVLCRFLGLEGDPRRGEIKRTIRAVATEILDREDPGAHNQALMELGATVCRPKQPRCLECPLEPRCVAARSGDPERFPPPRPRAGPELQHWVATVVVDRRGVWLVRLPKEAELLPGHWGLPLTRHTGPTRPGDAVAIPLAREGARAAFGVSPPGGEVRSEVRHAITFRRLRVLPIRFRGVTTASTRGPRKFLRRGEEDRIPALFRKIVQTLKG